MLKSTDERAELAANDATLLRLLAGSWNEDEVDCEEIENPRYCLDQSSAGLCCEVVLP